MVHTYIHTLMIYLIRQVTNGIDVTKSPDVDLLFLKDISIVFSIAFDCAQQVQWSMPLANNGIVQNVGWLWNRYIYFIEHRSQRLRITKVCGVTPAYISNAIHTQTETIFSVMQCFKHQATLLQRNYFVFSFQHKDQQMGLKEFK